MKVYFNNKTEIVPYAKDLIDLFDLGYPSTMIITREKSGAYFVHFAIDGSSVDTDWEQAQLAVAKFFSDTQPNT